MTSAAHALGGYSIAIGGGDDDTFPGPRSKGFRSIAIGQQSSTGDTGSLTGFGLGDFGTSLGFNTHTAFAATALGTDAQARGDSSSAVGRFASAAAASSIALGQSATASHSQSVAVGAFSVTNGAKVVSVGNPTLRRRITNMAAGISNSDAASLGQVKALIAAATASPQMASNSDVNDLRRQVIELRALLDGLKRQLAELTLQKTTIAAQH